jgi:hypothetical protein
MIFFEALKLGTSSTIAFLQTLHNDALGKGWIAFVIYRFMEQGSFAGIRRSCDSPPNIRCDGTCRPDRTNLLEQNHLRCNVVNWHEKPCCVAFFERDSG